MGLAIKAVNDWRDGRLQVLTAFLSLIVYVIFSCNVAIIDYFNSPLVIESFVD